MYRFFYSLKLTAALYFVAFGLLSSSAQTCPCDIWPPSTIPGAVDGGDPGGGEFGMRFQTASNGYIAGIRFYKSAANTGTHIGNLWSNTGTLLASATFTAETASGWQQVNFSTPVAVTAGTTYVASYFAPHGHYSFNSGFFSSALNNPPLTALADGGDGPNGVYSYGVASQFPNSSYNSSNYWVDVVYVQSDVPTITASAPAPGATGVSISTSVTATFSEAVDPTTVNGNTFQLQDQFGNPVNASVTYNAATETANLQPVSALANSAGYTAVVLGGANGPAVKNLRGNPLAANVPWSFTTGIAPTYGCPCSVWPTSTVPGTVDGGDPNGGEYGMRFQPTDNGYITGVRFYKSAANSGSHIGNLWSNTGTALASATFVDESSSGWQQVSFSTPVAVTAGTTYVVSYFAPAGHYSFNGNYFASPVGNPPMQAVMNGGNSPNGVYSYGASSKFPVSSYNASNYWVDAVYVPGNTTVAPAVISTSPANGASGVNLSSALNVVFSEPMTASTITSANFTLKDQFNNVTPGTVTYSSTSGTLNFAPSSSLLPLNTYTATVSGAVKDFFGNPLGSDYTWSFTTGPVSGNLGPGGPVLLISSVNNPFTRYYGEILLTEGLNEYAVQDISSVTAAMLSSYDVVLLGDMQLSAAQVAMLTSWVNGGGNLIAMHPDKKLAGLLGISSTGSTLSNEYLLVNTSTGPGAGIVNQTMQFHGTADLYNLNGATAVATLYSDASTPTSSPAVTLNSSGAGQASAFTYDLARSVIYTRQGNPAWSGQQRNPYIDPAIGRSQIRSDDLFFGNASFDPEPDWVNLNKVTVPQADEQQRLLVNLIEKMNANKKPLPRFWYFPSNFKAVVIMTGDDHNVGGTSGRFDQYLSASPTGCSIADWTCIRSTSYVFTYTPIPNYKTYLAQGFEIANHGDSSPTCTNYTPASLQSALTSELAVLEQNLPGLPAPKTNRTHCVLWSDFDSQPQIELQLGIRLDTTYYYWPSVWILDRPGLFTGSGIPMRFADRNGNTIDVYQAPTQMTDESGQTYPTTINTLLDNALGTQGFYGAFTANMHTDLANSPGSDAIIASAKARGVPVVSALQMLTWLDGRNGSFFGGMSWNSPTLSFTVTAASAARNLQALLPVNSPAGNLAALTRNGSSVSYTVQTIKGVQYAVFAATSGSYLATY